MAFRAGTWNAQCAKIESVVAELEERGGSSGHKAEGWNVYAVSRVPYPAQASTFPGPRVPWAEGLLRRLFRTVGWLPAKYLPGLGPLFGVRGAPKCLATAARAAGAVAGARDGGWGPSPERRQQKAGLG